MSAADQPTDTGLRCVGGFILLALSVSLGLSLFSYEWRDISLLQAPPITPPRNYFGPVGAWLSFGLFTLLGLGAYLAPVWCIVFGLILVLDREERVWPRGVWLAAALLTVVALADLDGGNWSERCGRLNIVDTGGLFSRLVVRAVLVRWVSRIGTGILLWAALVVCLLMLVEVRNIVRAARATGAFSVRAAAWVQAWLRARQDQRERIEHEERQIEKKRRRLERELMRKAGSRAPDEEAPVPSVMRAETAAAAAAAAKAAEEEAPEPEPRPRPPAPKPKPAPATTAAGEEDGAPPRVYARPPLDLLRVPPAARRLQADTSTTSHVLMETLREFGIEAEVTHVEQGPVVTRYQLLPAPGIRVERIANLSNNLALSLKATSVRVQAPIPGKGVVGIEVPNSTSTMVCLREVLEGDVWQAGKARLPLVLGKDVGGKDLVADLAEMPHLLIAGATGAGKTVCMNSVLAGLLMARTPDEMRLMLVDPKIVEFSVYNSLPHLVVPVITDPKKVALGLRWAINEMENRYKLFARAGVRNIEGYNNREIARQGDLFGEASGGKDGEPPERVPYIVIVIDELADLMLADQAEIENCVARLAQLSRAVGIHMILSTQRPSVNVITGTIKANFPARIAFQVAQKVDSRTILDSVGAEKLLGRGDMLFLPPGSSKLIRAQGAFTSDSEINSITTFIREQGQPEYAVEIKEKLEAAAPAAGETSEADEGLLAQAIEILRETRRASTSSLQRRLRIGYNRAGRLMDALEARGIVGPPRGSDPREILIDLDGEIPNATATAAVEEE
jgi:S-DNA-T family DNA segregation ATPase FtsK/SpoIIIE